MLFRARSLAIPLIDATAVVMAVHQNHDYSHHPGGKHGTRHGDEALNNETLAGDALQMFALTDATHVLTPTGLGRAYDCEHLLRYFETLPILHPWWPLRVASKAASVSRAFQEPLRLDADVDASRVGTLASSAQRALTHAHWHPAGGDPLIRRHLSGTA